MKIRLNTVMAIFAFVLAGCTTPASVDHDPVEIDTTYPPSMIELNFDSHGDRVNGILYQANGAGPHPTAILLHGYPGNERNLDLAQSMRRAGYNVLFFHYRGAWGSEGEYSITHVVEDVASAISYLRANARDIRVAPKRILVMGHSMGGFAALQGAARDETVKCVAGIAPADLGIIADLAKTNDEFAQGFAAGADRLAMLNGWSGQKVIAELKSKGDGFSLIDLAPKLSGKSVLLIAGEQDSVLAPSLFHTPLVAAYEAQSDVSLTHTLIPGDHSFSWSRNRLTQTVINWALNCDK
jgi:pimeloyl-ACP methyl ester carboxylesterase